MMAKNEEGVEPHKTHLASTDLVKIFELCNHLVVAVMKKLRLQWHGNSAKDFYLPL